MLLMSFLIWNFYKSVKRKIITLEEVFSPPGQHKMSINGFEKWNIRHFLWEKKDHNFIIFFPSCPYPTQVHNR